jgi:hypothetical protein
MPMFKPGGVILLLILVSACGGNSTPSPTTPTPAANRPPVVAGVSVSPQGMGIESATIFTFAAQGVSDPDGDALTYTWASSDGAPIPSSNQAASHVYARSGTFDMRVTVTDPLGLSASATVSITVGTVTGVWDVSCDRSAFTLGLCRNFPTQFVATLTQSGDSLFGSMTGGGRTNTFTLPGKVYNPRQFSFGVESFWNVWCPEDYSDFYFSLNANETLTSGTQSTAALYCRSATARKR